MNRQDTWLEQDEGSIVARAQDGELAAFEHLLITYQDRLFRLAFRMLNDRTHAEDVVQETFTTCWRSLPLLADVNAFGGWIYRLTTNKCLDKLRKRAAHAEIIIEPDLIRNTAELKGNQTPPGSDPAERAEFAALKDQLTAVLNMLPPAQRACWLLREMHGRSYAEIGDTLKLSPSTVRGALARARQQIAEGMSPWR